VTSAVVVAKEYVLMHDGNIGVVSSGIVGDGCIFYVDLKIAHSSEFDALSSAEGSNPSSSDVQKVDSYEPLTTGEVKPIVEDGIRSSGLPSNSVNSTPTSDQSNHFFTLMSLSPKANPPPTPSSSNLTPVAHPPPAKHSTKVIPGDSIIEGIKLSRALVVDDVASNRKMLGRVIQSRFHQIDYAENGKIAVDLVQESESNEGAIRFSVIFMDCNMPGDSPMVLTLAFLTLSFSPVMDGIEATKRIRALGFRGRMFGVTGNALGEDMEEFLSSGLDKVLTKPLNMEKLIQAMKGLVTPLL
jgi:CheY-like chemotaxis protein